MNTLKITLFGLIVLFLTSCSNETDRAVTSTGTTFLNSTASRPSSAEEFLDNTAFILKNRVAVNGNRTESARSMFIKNYDPSYRLLPTYALDGVDFTDDGTNYDLVAGDGIYTSVNLYPNPTSNIEDSESVYVFAAPGFKHTSQLIRDTATPQTFGVVIDCKVRTVYTGTTVLGFSCANGCIELYDCSVSFEFTW